MSFTDHKITSFQHKIADLADQPTLPPDELKSRFDACPEELRQSLNAVCDDAARLEARVEGIVVDTFGDTIDKEMLSDELAAELDAKATQTALSAEAAARESADDALDTRLTANETLTALKCQPFCGTYTGDGQAERHIELGFQPKAVLVMLQSGQSYFDNISREICYGGMAFPGTPCQTHDDYPCVTVDATGFTVYCTDIPIGGSRTVATNDTDQVFAYLALKA